MVSMAKAAILDADVHMHAEDQQPLGQHLHLLQHAQIARIGRHRLVGPAAEGVGRRGDDGHAPALGQIADKSALLDQLVT